jgi:hypothetical protein
MKQIVTLVVFGALSGLTLAVAPLAAQGVSGQAYGAVVTLATGMRQFAGAALPVEGGMGHASLDNAAVMNSLNANGLHSVTSGMADYPGSSAQTTAEAADVSILNGLITARQLLGVASSYVNQLGAASEATGSMLAGLVVNGVPVGGDALPPAHTRIELPGVGYVVLNEQTLSGNGETTSGITVNMIHVVLQTVIPGGLLGGGRVLRTGEIVVGSASISVGS